MRYQIHHQTTYIYNQPVFLKPHIVRLRPRSDGWQQLEHFSLTVQPEPTGTAQILDLDGNSLIQTWFNSPTEQLALTVEATVETFINNPFHYLLDPWALKLPFDYPSSLLTQLKPYLQPHNITLHPEVIQLAQDILHQSESHPQTFLATLNERIYKQCQYLVRHTGEPWQPGITWNTKQGSCRDTAVLFMEVCRSIGLAARFVSGYQEGDRDMEQWDLHAWVEVYLPGGGWRGYDPTHGLAIADQHIALAASAIPPLAAPVTGHVTPVQPLIGTNQVPQAKMDVHLTIKAI